MNPLVVNLTVRRLIVNNDSFQKALGFQIDGPNTQLAPGGAARGMYDVFDETRRVPGIRMHHAHAATIKPQKVGTVGYVIPRSSEQLPLLLWDLTQMRAIGGPGGEVDKGGEKYIMRQQAYLKQAVVNLREFQTVAMLRGSYGFTESGDDLNHGFTGTDTVDYQIPSGNKSQLDMLGAGSIITTSWANTAAPIITNLLMIDKAFTQLTGRGLSDIFCNSTMWANVLNNQQVQALAGAVNNPIREMKRDATTQEFTVNLNGMPVFTFHVTNNGVDLSDTFTLLIPDTMAIFTVKLSSEIAAYYECEEYVVDFKGKSPQPRRGAYFWSVPEGNPSRYDMFSLHNGIPVLYVPKAIAPATVVF